MPASTTSWGFFQQGNSNMDDVMRLGQKLNLAIECPIHYPAFGKRVFECKCGVLFPLFLVDGRTDEQLQHIHCQGQPQWMSG